MSARAVTLMKLMMTMGFVLVCSADTAIAVQSAAPSAATTADTQVEESETERPKRRLPDYSPGRVRPEKLDLSLRKWSDGRQFRVELVSQLNPIKLRKIHTWTIKVMDESGAGITDAKLLFDGGMPEHNHGFPTEPKITQHLGNGVYLLEGVRFSMGGWWEMRFKIEARGKTDRAVFNVDLDN